MDTKRVINQLNEILRWEYAGVVQYLQHSFIVQGVERAVYAEHFEEHAKEALGHAKLIGDKIAALGGVPTVERADVKQSTDLVEMLQYNLAVERKQVELYDEAIKMADDNAPLRVLLEDIIVEEQKDVEELEKILRTVKQQAGETGKRAKATG